MGNVTQSSLQPLFRVPGFGALQQLICSVVRTDRGLSDFVRWVASNSTIMELTRRLLFKPWGFIYGQRDFEWIFTRYFEEIYTPPVPHRCSMADNYIRNAEELSVHTVEHLAPEIKHETLVMAGMLDAIIPAYCSYDMHRKLPRSRIECWTFGTHFLMSEFPESSMAVLQRFLHAQSLEEYDSFKRQGLSMFEKDCATALASDCNVGNRAKA